MKTIKDSSVKETQVGDTVLIERGITDPISKQNQQGILKDIIEEADEDIAVIEFSDGMTGQYCEGTFINQQSSHA